MTWSVKLFDAFGIPVRMHLTFLMLLLWAGADGMSRGPLGAVTGVLFILALFGCVVLHELGHSLQARRYGIGVRDITLLPIGGVARMERMPEDPKQEMVISITGPLVNVGIATVLFWVLTVQGVLAGGQVGSLVRHHFLFQLMSVNIVLAFFNLLPAFPMDGGRVLRAYLAQKISYVEATHHAARIGQGLAIVLGLLGLFGNPVLVFVALFVYMGAASEEQMVTVRSWLHNVPVSAAMVTELTVLSPRDPVSQAVEHVFHGCQEDFPVAEGGRAVGILTQSDLLSAVHAGRMNANIDQIMRRTFEPVQVTDLLAEVQQRMASCGCPSLPVLRGDDLAGMVTLHSIARFALFQKAAHRM